MVAEGEGFEPSIRFPVYTLSKRAPSAARPPIQNGRESLSSGEGGIRTLEGLLGPNALAGRRLKPLGHLSKALGSRLMALATRAPVLPFKRATGLEPATLSLGS